MSVTEKSAQHICNVIRRMVKDNMPSLHIHFVLHDHDNKKVKLNAALRRMDSSIADDVLVEHIERETVKAFLRQTHSHLALTAMQCDRQFWSLRRHFTFSTLCFVNYSDFETEAHLKNHVYHLAWHAMTHHNIMKRAEKKTPSKPRLSSMMETVSRVEAPQYDERTTRRYNLAADIFAIYVQYIKGDHDIIQDMMQQRIMDTLSPKPHYCAEEFPLPIGIDTIHTIMAYEDEKATPHKAQIINIAYKRTQDTLKTYDNKSLEKWVLFASGAQFLAWTGNAPPLILGAALYTSTDSRVQAIADMIAEYTDIPTEVKTTLKAINPFVSSQHNATTHDLLWRETVRALLDKVKTHADYALFMDAGGLHNRNFIDNNMIGWSPYALLQAAKIIYDCEQAQIDDAMKNKIHDLCFNSTASLAWENIQMFSRQLFIQHRNGAPRHFETSLTLAAADPVYRNICSIAKQSHALEEHVRDGAPIAPPQTQDQNTPKGSIMDFISPNAVKNPH